jgi:hypothetical protein
MKMLFFSSERAEVESVRNELLAVGVPCEVRANGNAEGPSPNGSAIELWIQNDGDAHRAAMLCVELGLGFARRPLIVAQREKQSEECGSEFRS